MRVARFQSHADIFTCLYKVACVFFFVFFLGDRRPYRRTSDKEQAPGSRTFFLQSENKKTMRFPGFSSVTSQLSTSGPIVPGTAPREAAEGTSEISPGPAVSGTGHC